MGKSSSGEYRIKKNKYFVITLIIILIFVVFEIICNFDYFLNLLLNRGADSYMVDESLVTIYAYEEEDYSYASENAAICIWADEKFEDEKLICAGVFQNQKRTYQMIESLDEIEETKPEVLFVLKDTLSDEEISQLEKSLFSDVQIVFVVTPNKQTMEKQDVQELMGIYRQGDLVSRRGIRFIPNFFVTDELIENETVSLKMYDVTLGEKTKLYAYSFLDTEEGKQVENEALPPAIWRRGYRSGNVFVLNGNFAELGCLEGIITSLFSVIYEDDIYPVVNAYGVFIQCSPYIKETENETVERLYSRDAMGFQQDIVFPSIISSVRKNQYIPTFFCSVSDYDGEMERYIEKQVEYMEKEIVSLSGEIGLYYEGSFAHKEELNCTDSLMLKDDELLSGHVKRAAKVIVSKEADNRTLVDRDYEYTYIPIVRDDMQKELQELKEISYVTELGLLTAEIDIEAVLNNKGEEYNWVTYSKTTDSVLGEHGEKYQALTRLSASDMGTRVLAHDVLRPRYEKTSESIWIRCDKFSGAAFFVLRTPKEIVDIKNGTYQVLGEDAYLISINNREATIYFEEEKDAS